MQNKETLLSKYKIPIQHLDFDYIEKCQDGKELERILEILKSGEEGHYPDLLLTAEKRLELIKPKSRYLRRINPVLHRESLDKQSQLELNQDLKNWVNNVNTNDNKLSKIKTTNNNSPEIRKTKQIKEKPKEETKRIKSTDYKSWDKYDADTELLKIDLEQEKLKKTIKSQKKRPIKQVVPKFTNDIEAQYYANYEKNKGNEFFKTNDYEDALYHYTNSINCKLTVSSLTNRALTYLKLKQFNEALNDCQMALKLEPHNMKSITRKAMALDGLGNIEKALKTVELAIKIEPNNDFVQELAEKFRKKCGVTMKKTRFNITDTNSVTISIPSSSKNETGPHIIVCNNDNDKIRAEIIKNNTNSVMHIVSIDNSSDSDDDCHTIHIKRNANDKQAAGDEFSEENQFILPNDLHSPYCFLKTWSLAASNDSLENYAVILRNLDMSRIREVIGCKLDNAMFSIILKCLATYFTVPDEIDRLYDIIRNIIKVPRFDIIFLLISEEDRQLINTIINFLNQHGKYLPNNILKIINNS